ncbi:hypothetical protein C8R43DRAFT_974816 [Mycena crocata]|nr:hypothetical protein C8R43DRAFT_974816 [Mycena crocata]
MITDIKVAHATAPPTMSRRLNKGRACMNCRKQKCDGLKPICGSCRKHPKDDECEYSDGPARSRTRALEDTVARLEARLYALEHPEDSTPSVTLYDPYTQYTSPPQFTISPPHPTSRSLPNNPYHQLCRLLTPFTSSPESQGLTPLSPFSPPSTTASSPPSGTHGHGISPLGIFDSRSSEGSTPELHTFLPHASQFGFFLDSKRFIPSALQSMSMDNVKPACPALMNAVYMWGAHLSGDPREERFRYQALQYAATDLVPSHAQSFLQTIQAEILLSYYFFRTGRFLEARAHTATAVALAVGGGLHQIRSIHRPAVPVFSIAEEHGHDVHPREPADSVEEGERITGFWAVFILQQNLSIALDPPARVCSLEASGMLIDTPWPLEMEDYRQGSLTSDIEGDSTVRGYLCQPGAPSYDGGASIIAMNIKACILLHRAVYLHGHWTSNHSARESQSWWTPFRTIEQLISALRSQLPDLAQLDGRSPARTILLTHSLLNAAIIKLHSMFMYSDTTSRDACLAAARDMFRFGDMNIQGLGYLNPIMGTLWEAACGVFIAELNHLRSIDNAWPSQGAAESEKEMYVNLQDGFAALNTFARGSLLMRHQFTKTKEAAGGL